MRAMQMLKTRAIRMGIAGAALLTSVLAGQTPPLMSFEVASVKPHLPGDTQSRGGVNPGGRFTVENWPLFRLIAIGFQAYRDFEVVGAPEWTRNTRFDIDARAPAGIELGALTALDPPTPAIQMLRSLLIERFAVKVHIETRDLPGYALVMARADRRFGPKFAAASVDCEAERLARRARGESKPYVPPTLGQVSRCVSLSRPGWISAGSYPLHTLVTPLSQELDRPIVDRTGLTGFFDFELIYATDVPNQTGVAADSPALLTAIQEQLGLKLEPVKIPARVVVVEAVSQPTPD